jgi:hypothetical protein
MTAYYRSWQEFEKAQLWIAYKLKVPLKVLAAFFNCSPAAINKALYRFEIRPSRTCQRGVEKGRSHKAYITLKDFSSLMKECHLELPYNQTVDGQVVQGVMDRLGINLRNCNYSLHREQEPPPIHHLDAKTIMSARFDSPFADQALPELEIEDVERQNVLAQARPWLSLEALIEKLSSYGVKITRYDSKSSDKSENRRFLMNGLPVSPGELLMKANKIFLAHGESSVYVDEITL